MRWLLGLRHLGRTRQRRPRWGQPAARRTSASSPPANPPLRILIVYDCIYPWSIGGAERWYRALAETLAESGHAVTYLSLAQWQPKNQPDPATLPQPARTAPKPPGVPGVRLVAAGPNLPLYAGPRRRLWPPLRFGLGVLWHLLRHGRDYDVVHTASFPYWPLLAAAAVRPLGQYRLVVDWWEVWTAGYWREYAGTVIGTAGWLVQRACVRLGQRAFCYSRLHAERLAAERFRGSLTLLRGIHAGARQAVTPSRETGPMVLFAGRHIPEKRLRAIVPAIALARQSLPTLHAVIAGDGPDQARLKREIAAAGLTDVIALPGFIDEDALAALYQQAMCFLLPSRREGYGLAVVEAAAHGTPSIVVRGPDNAATELIDEEVNGVVAPSASAPDLASAILRVYAAGPALRRSTAAWYAANRNRLALTGSLARVSAAYLDQSEEADCPCRQR